MRLTIASQTDRVRSGLRGYGGKIRQFGGAPCLFKPVQPGELARAILSACGL
jgi:hypothetical protein